MKKVMKSFIKKISTMALFVFVMSSSVFVASSTSTTNVSVIGKYGISKQECGMGNGVYCMKWSASESSGATTQEIQKPLIPITKNSDNTYTLLTDNIYIQYFLIDASGNAVGSGHVSPAFKDAISWDGKSNIITYKSGKEHACPKVIGSYAQNCSDRSINNDICVLTCKCSSNDPHSGPVANAINLFKQKKQRDGSVCFNNINGTLQTC